MLKLRGVSNPNVKGGGPGRYVSDLFCGVWLQNASGFFCSFFGDRGYVESVDPSLQRFPPHFADMNKAVYPFL